MARFNEQAQRWFDNFADMAGDGNVPCSVAIDAQAWRNSFSQYCGRLRVLKAECPGVAMHLPEPGQEVGRAGEVRATDPWGCRWLYNETSNDGQVVGHPLQDWDDIGSYGFPDPDTYLNWPWLREQIDRNKQEGNVSSVGIEHGFFFLRLTYLRGYENFMLDVAELSDEFLNFLDKYTGFWLEIAERIAAMKPDVVYWGDDLGAQKSLPISPGSWRKLIKPAYARIMAILKGSGAYNFLHTDGNIVDIISDLIECGVDILNPQDLVNGLDNLSALAKGRVSINLDIDRQMLTPFGEPDEIRDHITNCVKTLGSPTGGLSLIYGAYSGVPVENLEAVVRAMQESQNYWTRR